MRTKPFTPDQFHVYTFELRSRYGRRTVKVICPHANAARMGAGAASDEEIVPLAFPKRISHLDELFGMRVSRAEVADFFGEMSRALRSNIPEATALKKIVRVARTPYFRGVIASLWHLTNSGAGLKLGEAMALFPEAFDDIMVSLVSTGEETGDSEAIFARLASLTKSNVSLSKKIIGALLYPLGMLIMAGTGIILMVQFVIPRLAQQFLSLGGKLPMITKICLEASDFMRVHWYLWLLLTAAAVYVIAKAGYYYRTMPKLQSFVVRIPLIGNMVRKAILQRSIRALSMLLNRGVNHVTAYTMTGRVAGHHEYAAYFQTILSAKSDGVADDRAFMAARHLIGEDGLYIAGRVEIAESTGQISPVLNDIADIFEEDVKYQAERLPELLNLFLLPLIALVVGGIAIVIYVPIAQNLMNVLSSQHP